MLKNNILVFHKVAIEIQLPFPPPIIYISFLSFLFFIKIKAAKTVFYFDRPLGLIPNYFAGMSASTLVNKSQ